MRLLQVRATIAFGGLKAGAVVWIDLDDAEVARYLDAGFLVALDE